MKVTVIKEAFYGGSIIKKGTVVDVPENFKASWAVPSTEVKAKAEPEKPKRPKTQALSEIGKESTQSFTEVLA